MTSNTQKIRIIVNGAYGRMGQETVKAIENEPGFDLVAQLGHSDDLAKKIHETKANVVVDFTTPAVAYANTRIIIESNVHPVIGTTGLSPQQIAELQELSLKKKIGGVIAPNFSIGAVLLMKFARETARYFPHVEIIELHHDAKKDAPSGTALKTAEMIAENRREIPAEKTEQEILPGARGGIKNDIHIHSIRLPGLVAHEEVIFGGVNETLTLRHDSIHRSAFMPGVILTCKKVMELENLVYGLEKLLF